MLDTITKITPNYNPTMEALIGQCETDWGDPTDNRKLLLPYGIKLLDKGLYGLDTINGEIVLIQGEEKKRKTTFAENVLVNYMMGPLPVEKPLTCIDTLESGMNPKRYRDSLLSMVATRWLLKNGHAVGSRCPACQANACQCFGITPEFLMYNQRNSEQIKAIKWAMEVMAAWPVLIYGANPAQGNTRDLNTSVIGVKNIEARWERLIKEYNCKVFVTDHLQQYQAAQGATSDYEKQIATIGAVSNVVAKWGIVNLLISQVSLGSVREAKNGGEMSASGGKKAAQEATTILDIGYDAEKALVSIGVARSRKAGTFTVLQPIEVTSGTFHGESVGGN